MADEASSDQKTQEPSARKLQRARARGQVAQSREVNTWFMVMAGTGLVLFMAPPVAKVLARALVAFIELQNFLGPAGVRWPQVEAALGEVALALMLPLLTLVLAAAARHARPDRTRLRHREDRLRCLAVVAARRIPAAVLAALGRRIHQKPGQGRGGGRGGGVDGDARPSMA